MELEQYLGLVHRGQCDLAETFAEVAEKHSEEAAVFHVCQRLARQCEDHVRQLAPFLERYGEEGDKESHRLRSALFKGKRKGGVGLLRDLHDLYVMVAQVDMAWTVVAQAAQGAHDEDLLEVVNTCEQETATQMDWLRTMMKQAAPQALVVA